MKIVQTAEVLGPIFVGLIIVGAWLMVANYRRYRGVWPPKQTVFLFLKIMLALTAVGSAVGLFLGRK
jgi:hypothetical protein